MPVANIKDHRTNSSNVLVNATYEPAWHDNDAPNATQFPVVAAFDVEELEMTTVENAILHALQWDIPVTLYLYDV